MNLVLLRAAAGITGLLPLTIPVARVFAQPQAPAQTAPVTRGASARDLFVTAGKSVVLDSPVDIERVSIANPVLAEAVVVNPREVLVNGKAPGETTLIVWQQGGNRLFFDLKVSPNTTEETARLESVRQEISKQLPGQDITFTFKNNTVFLEGTANNLVSAERAVAIASTLGKTVNLLNVKIPGTEAQVLLKVRFADVDRAATIDLGMNLVSTGATNTIGRVTTGSNSPPQVVVAPGAPPTVTLSDALNIFLFRPDLNLLATIKALQGRNLLQILAEPNVLAINGKSANFLAGGEFPYPTLQGGGAGLGAVTIAFREFGVRINFLPLITPRGTIRLQVTPEVSALDYANALIFQGFTIPGLSTRRVQTEIELEDGQSFAIGGLLDNRLTETFAKIPGLGDIPVLGKLFQSRTRTKNNSELLVLVTPQLVRPIPVGQPRPGLDMPEPFMQGVPTVPPQTPGTNITGPVPVKSPQESMPVEELMQLEKTMQAPPSYATPAPAPVQFVPVPMMPAQPQPAAPAAPAAPTPAPAPAPAPPSGGGSSAG